MLQLMHLVLDLLQMAKRRQRRFMHSRARVEVNMLGQQSELESAGTRNFAAIRSLFFVYQAKNRRLAGAVTSDQTDMLTGIDLKRGAAQNVLSAEGFVNVGKPKQHFRFWILPRAFEGSGPAGRKPRLLGLFKISLARLLTTLASDIATVSSAAFRICFR